MSTDCATLTQAQTVPFRTPSMDVAGQNVPGWSPLGSQPFVFSAGTPPMDVASSPQISPAGSLSVPVGGPSRDSTGQGVPNWSQMTPPGSQVLSFPARAPSMDATGQGVPTGVQIAPLGSQTLSFPSAGHNDGAAIPSAAQIFQAQSGYGTQIFMAPMPPASTVSFMDAASMAQNFPSGVQISPPGTHTFSFSTGTASIDSASSAQTFPSGSQPFLSGTASMLSGAAPMDAASLSQMLPSGTQTKVVAGTFPPRADLVDTHCVILGLNGADANLLMVVTASGSLEPLLPQNLVIVQIKQGSRVVIVDAYHELDPQLALQAGTLTDFQDGMWSVSLDSPKQGMSQSVQVSPRNIVFSASSSVEPENWAGQQAKVVSAAKAELIDQYCVVLGFDATRSDGSQLMVLLASGGLESLSPENLVKVPISTGSRAVIVDAYQQLDPQLALKQGVLTAFKDGLWTVNFDSTEQGANSSVQISARNLVLFADNDHLSEGDGSVEPSDMIPEEGSFEAPPSTKPVTPSLLSSWDRMQSLQDEVCSDSHSDCGEESQKESSVQLDQKSEVEGARLEAAPDGKATLLHLVCISRKGLMRDLANELSDVGVDVEQCDIAAPKGHTVAELRIVDAETGGPINPERYPEIRDVAQATVAAAAAKSGPSRTMRGRRAFRANSVEFSNFTPATPTSRQNNRSQKRVLIIGPGFGLDLNKEQIANVYQAGFQVKVVLPPNPETPGFNMAFALGEVKAAIDEFQPDMVGAASKGGYFLLALWQTGQWKGPSLLINAHPSCLSLPQNVPIVVAQGSNDKIWPRARADLEKLISTGTRNMCFLYYTANSGRLGAGYTRQGDEHNMQSLLHYDCLPRLIDAVISKQPELLLMRSWLGQIHGDRLAAERWLGYSAEQFRKHWTSTEEGQLVVEVSPISDEFQKVATIFRANPVEKEQNVYQDQHLPPWESTGIVRIQRVQNEMQLDGSFLPYYEQLKSAVESQGITFEKGVHTRWAFHGTDAVDAIISNPISGFQPLASGTRSGSIWGPGSYFARDAKYVARAGYAATRPDGTRQALLCLLTTGLPCLGDPENHGVLPARCGQHRYHSCVDSMNNPEIHIIQNSSAAYPAYIITFV